MGIDKKKIRAALLKGERITLEAKRAEKDVTKSVWETHSAFANYNKPVFIMYIHHMILTQEHNLDYIRDLPRSQNNQYLQERSQNFLIG